MYLEIDEGFPEHPKTLQLCAFMENPTAFAYLLNFWRWACRSCKDGDLRGMSVYAIEEAAKYHRHDGKLYQAMVAKLGGKAGFLDADENGVATGIHNWGKRTGAAILRMEGEADRKRMYRAHKDGKCGQGCKWCETEGGQKKDGGGLSTGRPQDIPTQSSPVQSSPDKTSQEPENTDCAETPAASSPPVEPALLTFPCDGSPNRWNLTQSQVDHWHELFPSLDIMAQCRSALAWVEANPSKRKTASGMPKTLVAWFARTQNRGGQQQQSFAARPQPKAVTWPALGK